jgi:GAF domain-containing protein
MPDSATLGDVARITALVMSERDPTPAYRAVDALAKRIFDHRLLTVMRFIEETVEVERLYSSNTEAYPVGGRKRKAGTPWGEQVLDRGRVFICHSPEDITRAFTDHDLIFSLGVGGMINVPILIGGRCIGTLNISAAGDRFHESDIPDGRLLAGLLLPLVMAGALAR